VSYAHKTVRDFVHAHLVTIAEHLAVDAKLTLVVRVPDNADAYLVFGDTDDLDLVLETVKRAQRDAEAA
jgi:hypothetical protein